MQSCDLCNTGGYNAIHCLVPTHCTVIALIKYIDMDNRKCKAVYICQPQSPPDGTTHQPAKTKQLWKRKVVEHNPTNQHKPHLIPPSPLNHLANYNCTNVLH